MNELQQTPAIAKSDIRAMRIFFNALVGGAILFSLIVLALAATKAPVSPIKEYENIMLAFVTVLGLVCFILARKSYNRGIAVAKDSLISLPDKLNQYRLTLIRYMTLCEGHALFGVILYFLTGNYLMFIVTAAMIAAMVSKAPGRQKVIDELGLNWEEQQQLD